MNNFERLEQPEEVERRKYIVFEGLNNLKHTVVMAFPNLEASQPVQTVETPPFTVGPEPIYNLADYRPAPPPLPATPEIAVHENQSGINEAQALVDQALETV